MPTGNGLLGSRIVITRPEGQGTDLQQALVQRGIHSLLLPLTKIESIELLPAQNFAADLYIFISPNAVEYGLSYPELRKAISTNPVYAIGKTTQQHLKSRGILQATCPEQPDSESLLQQVSMLDLVNRRIMIVCGKGGRQILESCLSQAGAQVSRLEVYQRSIIEHHRFQQVSVEVAADDCWLFSSAETMETLRKYYQAPLTAIVTSERLAQMAVQMNMSVAAVCPSAYPKDIVTTIEQWLNSKTTP